jgi:RNA polymerase sigma factor (sigma-70 family)
MAEVTTPALLARAADGDASAWELIVDRHHRLVWSVVRSFRLDDAAAADVFQTVWLRLVEQIDRIRDPERLPAWLATTARRESLRVLRRSAREAPSELLEEPAAPLQPALVDALLAGEEHRAVLTAFGRLSEGCQALLRLLVADPPLDYRTVADLVGRPVGSIGPTRQRCLDRLRALVLESDPDMAWEG